jgi:hypothetical protein
MNPFAAWLVKYVLPYVSWFVSLFIPGRDSAKALQEGKNKAWIMSMVNNLEQGFPPLGTFDPMKELHKLVDVCYAMGQFASVWSVEGLGLYHIEAMRAKKMPVRNALTDPVLNSVPAKSMTMLHAGIGLSIGRSCLMGLTADSPRADLRKALQEFISLCRENSRPGYTGCAYESLGLVALIRHNPALARVLDRELADIDPEVATYMWRGAGRALYFHPKNFVPGFRSAWPGIAMSRAIAPHETARRNLRAGVAWPTTIVNMRHPQIMESVLLHQGENDPDRELFVNGVVSSMTMRYDTSPDDPYITSFINHRPDPRNQLLCRLWQRDIKEPCEMAINDIHPTLIAHQAIEEVFHYQSLPDLVARLKSGQKSRAEQGRV